MAIDFSRDPVLRFGQAVVPADQFRSVIGAAVARHPAVREAAAAAREADAAQAEATAGLFPTVDITLLGDRVISREFSNDPFNIIERSRPEGRTDAQASITQTLLDFGATFRRMKAARARKEAAKQQIHGSGDEVALRAISAWYDLAAYRTLVAMGESLAQSQAELREAVKMRIRQGLSAEGDLARVDTYITSAEARLAGFRRQLARAEASYREAIGMAAPLAADRPTLPAELPSSLDAARASAANAPQVKQADALRRAAQADYGVVKAENLPRIQAVIDSGRYGVFETARDYDVRGRIVLRHRLFGGGGEAREHQALERYAAQTAAAERVRDAAERDAAVAFTDLAGSKAEIAALERAYIANRRSRDALAERFKVTRGTLLDVLDAEDDYFQIATSYVRAVTENDALRLVLLQRGGSLLDALGVQLPEGER